MPDDANEPAPPTDPSPPGARPEPPRPPGARPEPPRPPGARPEAQRLRRDFAGGYRADGLVGPTRRYILMVALLVALASLPTLAAITAGTNTIDDVTNGAPTVPFLPPPSDGPVVVPRPADPAEEPAPPIRAGEPVAVKPTGQPAGDQRPGDEWPGGEPPADRPRNTDPWGGIGGPAAPIDPERPDPPTGAGEPGDEGAGRGADSGGHGSDGRGSGGDRDGDDSGGRDLDGGQPPVRRTPWNPSLGRPARPENPPAVRPGRCRQAPRPCAARPWRPRLRTVELRLFASEPPSSGARHRHRKPDQHRAVGRHRAWETDAWRRGKSGRSGAGHRSDPPTRAMTRRWVRAAGNAD